MTTEHKTRVVVQRVEGEPDVLFCHYQDRTGPQPCYISLDLRNGQMRAEYEQTDNSVPSDVWHGVVRRYRIPALQPDTVNALMDQITPLAQRVIGGSEIVWDGHNHVARLNRDAKVAESLIDGSPVWDEDDPEETGENCCLGILSQLETDVHVWDASEWLAPIEDDVREKLTKLPIEEVYKSYQGDGSNEDEPVVIGLREYLEQLKP